MITNMYPLGSCTLTDAYFADLVAHAIQSCFGVAGMSAADPSDNLRSLIGGKAANTCGVRVTSSSEGIAIESHIKMAYGVNIRSSVQSIAHRVRNEVESATNLKVARVDICVDDIVCD